MTHRREFLTRFLKATAAAALPFRPAESAPQPFSPINLVPSAPSRAPNYWCTWCAQNYMYGQGLAHLDPALLEGGSGANIAERELNQRNVFGPGGWADTFLPTVRGELFFLFDEGWESGDYASILLHEERFPSFEGSAELRLQTLQQAIQAKGWRAAALWCRDTPPLAAARPLVQRCTQAHIPYLKIDGGDADFAIEQARDQQHATCLVEHVHGEMPLNGDWRTSGRFEPQTWDSPRVQTLRRADVYRTYDTNSLLSVPTTIDRASQLLHAAQNHPEISCLLNVEDEVYIAAALGCTMGVMRFPLSGLRPGNDPDLFFAGPRQAKKRMDEVTRAVRWQRIAAPYPAGSGFVRLDNEILTDDWIFAPGETWWTETIGHHAFQGAPARVSRNLELPELRSSGEKPWLLAARFPNGAVSLAVHERTHAHQAWTLSPPEVALNVADAPGPFGLFGRFGGVTLRFDRPVHHLRLLAQDLAGHQSTDITAQVSLSRREVHLPGKLLAGIGLTAAGTGDLSSPAVVLQWGK